MPRIDKRINVSFKNNPYEDELFDYVKYKGEIMGDSAYIKMLIQKDMLKDEEYKDKKNRP